MKKKTILAVPAFILVDSVFLGMGWEALLSMMSFCFGGAALYPRYALFCIGMGVVAFVGFIGILLFNINISDKLKYTPKVWYFQFILSFALSIPMLAVWEKVFEYIRSMF